MDKVCPYHGEDCLNYKSAKYADRPHVINEFGYDDEVFGQRSGILNTANKVATLTGSKCPFTRLWSLVILCRRMKDSKAVWGVDKWTEKSIDPKCVVEFFDTVFEYYWLFHDRASLRVKLSIIDTIADWSESETEKSNASLITVFFRMEVLSQTTSEARSKLSSQHVWHTIQPVYSGFPDTIENMLIRTNEALKQTPYLAKLFHSMFLEILPYSRLADYAIHCKIDTFLQGLRDIVRPDYLNKLPSR